MNKQVIYSLLRKIYKNKDKEHIILIGIKGDIIVLIADVTETNSSETSTFKFSKTLELLKKLDCDSCILSHNHPMGIALPSDGDIKVTKEFLTYLKKENIILLEHFIYAEGIFWRIFQDSFHKKGGL